MRQKAAFTGIIIALLIIFPNFLAPYYKELLIEMLIFGLYCLGFDIIFGFTGLLNFGMSVFFGLGSYLALLSILHLHVGLWTALLITIAGSAVFSFVYGLLVSRFKSHYFVAFTIVVSTIFFYMAMAKRPITGADEGITIIVPPLKLFQVGLQYFLLPPYVAVLHRGTPPLLLPLFFSLFLFQQH